MKYFLLPPLDAAWSPRSVFSSFPRPEFGFGHLSTAQPQLRTPVTEPQNGQAYTSESFRGIKWKLECCNYAPAWETHFLE